MEGIKTNHINTGCLKIGGDVSESDSTIDEKNRRIHSMKINEKDNSRYHINRSEMNVIDNDSMICSVDLDGDMVLNRNESESKAAINDNMKSMHAMKDNQNECGINDNDKNETMICVGDSDGDTVLNHEELESNVKTKYTMKSNKNERGKNNSDKNETIKLDYYNMTCSIESDGNTTSNNKDIESDVIINENTRRICAMKRNDNDDASNHQYISESNDLNDDEITCRNESGGSAVSKSRCHESENMMNENERRSHLVNVNMNKYSSNTKYESQFINEDVYDMAQSVESVDDIVEKQSSVNEGMKRPYQSKTGNNNGSIITYNINQINSQSKEYTISSISSKSKNNNNETIIQFLDKYDKDMRMIDDIIKNDDNRHEVVSKISCMNSSASISGLTDNWKEKVAYPTLYHIIMIGSTDYKYNHFASKDFKVLDQESYSKNRIHCSAYECEPSHTLRQVFHDTAMDIPHMPIYSKYFIYVKGDHCHLLVNDNMTINQVNRLIPSVDVGKLYYCLILERANSNEIEPKKNALLHLMSNQRKFNTTKSYPFTKSAGVGRDNIKVRLLEQFENEGVTGACSPSQAELMNKSCYWACCLIHYLDGHIGKMHRANGFSLPLNLAGFAGRNEANRVFKLLNKERLKDLETKKLIEYNKSLAKSLHSVFSPLVVKSETFKSLITLKKNIDSYIAHCLKHSIKQDEHRNATRVVSHRSGISPLTYKSSAVTDGKLAELIGKLQALKVGTYLSLKEFEDRFVHASIESRKISNDRELELVNTYRRMARQKFRTSLEKGLPVENIMLFTHVFGNNKPSVRIAFKVTSNDRHRQIAEGVSYCQSQVPVFLSRSQYCKIELAIKNIKKMKFTKNSTCAKYIMSIVAEEYNLDSNLSEEDRKAIDNEMGIILAMENNDLIKDCLIDHKKFYGGESDYDAFIDKMLEVLDGEAVPHARRNNSSLYSYRFVCVEDTIDEVAQLLPPETPIPGPHWVLLQFTPANCRAKRNEKLSNRIPMKKLCQRHTIVKDHVDGHYSNAQAKIVRNAFKMLTSKNCLYWSCDDKNKLKIGPPGEPLALAARARKVWVSQNKDFNSLDHDMGIKAPMILSSMLNINEPVDDKLGSMYNGNATIWLKDGTLQTSDPFRHATELIKDNLCKSNLMLMFNIFN